MTQDLNGKVAIVTGASSGIGLETVKHYLDAGTKVVGAARNTANLAELGDPSQVVGVDVDLMQPGSAEQVVKTALDTFGRIDILFNNAGVGGGPMPMTCQTSSGTGRWRSTSPRNSG